MMGAYEEGLRGPITQKGAGGGHARVNEQGRGVFDGTTCYSIHPYLLSVRAIPLANGSEGTGKIYYQGDLMPKSFVRNFNNFNLRKSSAEVVFRSSEWMVESKHNK